MSKVFTKPRGTIARSMPTISFLNRAANHKRLRAYKELLTDSLSEYFQLRKGMKRGSIFIFDKYSVSCDLNAREVPMFV